MAALPPYYEKSGVMQSLQYAAARELERIAAAIAEIAREYSPATAAETLPEWEAEYGIAGEGEPTDARRARVAVKMRGATKTTLARISAIVAEMGGGQAHVVEDAAHYAVTIGYTATLSSEDAAALSAALRAVIPAHLAVAIGHTDVRPVIVYATAAGLRQDNATVEVEVDDT